jgi:hypothetical protein
VFAAQERSIWTRGQNRKTGNVVKENADFLGARPSRCQDDAPALCLYVQRVARPEAELTTNWTGQDHLTLR